MNWLLEHTEVTTADRAFVWRHLSDVGNWSDPPASFVLHGAFDTGTRFSTRPMKRMPVSTSMLRESCRGRRSPTRGVDEAGDAHDT